MNILGRILFLFLSVALGNPAQANKVRSSELKSFAKKWCESSDIYTLGFDACHSFCSLQRSNCEEGLMKTTDLMLKCSPEKQEQFKQMVQQFYGECKAQVRPLEEMRFASRSLCAQSRTLPEEWQEYCSLLRSTCEETILKTQDLMMRCSDKQKASWLGLQFEKFKEALSANPSTLPPLTIEESKPTLAELFNEECNGQPSKPCSGFCSLSRGTCEENILKTRDLMMRCAQEQQAQWNKKLDDAYNICFAGVDEALVVLGDRPSKDEL